MRILTRYILREYVVPLGYCLCGFASIYVLFELFGSFSRIADADLPLSTAVEYFCAYLSPFFEWLAPAALMLAALYTMWQFCRHSELVAMKASGIGFHSIAAPVLCVAAAMAVAVCIAFRRTSEKLTLRSLSMTAVFSGYFLTVSSNSCIKWILIFHSYVYSLQFTVYR